MVCELPAFTLCGLGKFVSGILLFAFASVSKYKISKLLQLQHLQKLQNMNYGNYTYYKINKTFFYIFSIFFELFPNVRVYFGILGVFCTINRYFEYRIRILCI